MATSKAFILALVALLLFAALSASPVKAQEEDSVDAETGGEAVDEYADMAEEIEKLSVSGPCKYCKYCRFCAECKQCPCNAEKVCFCVLFLHFQ
jgi:hypothetical protein